MKHKRGMPFHYTMFDAYMSGYAILYLSTSYTNDIRWMEEILHQLIGGLSHYS